MAAGRLQGVCVANRGRATAVMVAERAGVSIASVSRVLNGLTTSDDVRRNVLRGRRRARLRARRRRPLVEGRAHRPGRPRRRRRRQPGLRDDDARHLPTSLAGAGYRLVISVDAAPIPPTSSASSPASVAGTATASSSARCGSRPSSLDALAGHAAVPSSSSARCRPRSTSTTCAPTRPAGVGLALDHLVAQGRRRIAFVNGPVDTVPGAARLRGFLQHGAALDLATPADMQVESATSPTTQVSAPPRTLLGQATPDAIMCANDLLAVAALNVLRRRGISRARRRRRRRHGRHRHRRARVARRSPASTSAPPARAAAAAELLLGRLDDDPAPRAAPHHRGARPHGPREHVDGRALASRSGSATATPAPQAAGQPRPASAGRGGGDAWKLVLPACSRSLLFSVYPLLRGIYLGFTDAEAGLNVDHDVHRPRELPRAAPQRRCSGTPSASA